LEAFLAILHFLGTDIDADELACILANLIAQVVLKISLKKFFFNF